MARPTKQGIDYFPLDTEFDDDLQLLIAETGAEGLGILITIWQAIYKGQGYYISYDKKFPLKIKQKCFSSVENIVNVVRNAIDVGIFDINMYENHRILTSRGLQKRYFAAARLKKQVEIIPKYMLINVSGVGNGVNVVGNGVNVVGNATKVKVKVKEKVKVKVKEKNTTPPTPNPKIPYQEIVSYLNKKTDKNFKSNTPTTKALIKARWKQGFTFDNFKFVIKVKSQQWLNDPKCSGWLRPQTLFSNKFESYLNEKNNPLQGKVSETTMKNINVLNEWEAGDEG